jgi:hypothetical protein
MAEQAKVPMLALSRNGLHWWPRQAKNKGRSKEKESHTRPTFMVTEGGGKGVLTAKKDRKLAWTKIANSSFQCQRGFFYAFATLKKAKLITKLMNENKII